MGTLVAEALGIGILMYGMRGHPGTPSPELHFGQVVRAFSSLVLAYGSGIVIPSIHRQHSDPKRMPRVVGVTVGTISILFLILASTAYSTVGCHISGNISWTIYPDAHTGLTALGYSRHWGLVILAYLGMQVQLTVVFSVILKPRILSQRAHVVGGAQTSTR